jgi:hypothetical protein
MSRLILARPLRSIDDEKIDKSFTWFEPEPRLDAQAGRNVPKDGACTRPRSTIMQLRLASKITIL